MPEWCPTAFARLEIHGCIVRRTLLPTPLKEAAPLEGSGAHGRLGRLAFVALLLRIDWGPAGLPWGCRRPRHARVAPARRPRRAVTGAIPASFWRASAEATRARWAPQA